MSGCFLWFSMLVVARAATADWELSVCLGDRVEALDSGGGTVKSLGLGPSTGRADVIALDYLSGQLLLADSKPSNSTIFSLSVHSAGLDSFRAVVPKASRTVAGVAYDIVEQAVFWTTGRQGTILRSTLPVEGKSTETQLIHSFSGQVPHGIAVDSCRRKLYWSNCNVTVPSIEMSDLDGADRHVLVDTGLFQPLTLTFSQGDGYLYWADEGSGYSFTIERIRFDGTGRVTLVKSSRQQPISVAVVPGEKLYWTDRFLQAVWSLELGGSSNVNSTPILVKQYKESMPSGLVAMRQDTRLDPVACSNIIHLKQQEEARSSQTVQCPEGYCLHEGNCSTVLEEDAPICTCKDGYLGDRCQYEERLCSVYCEGNTALSDFFLYQSCRCVSVGASEGSEALLGDADNYWRLATMCLSASCVALLLATVALALRTRTLSKRPKLRRRYTVNKGPGGGKRGGIASEKMDQERNQCEIGDIENCCNMNICETPCYEPEFRTPVTRNNRDFEHRSLIADMEVPEPTRPPL